MADDDRVRAIIRKKYGIEYRVAMLVERVVSRGARGLVTLRITSE